MYPSLFDHPAQYHFVNIIRRDILWVKAYAAVFAGLSLGQLEGDTVDAGGGMLF